MEHVALPEAMDVLVHYVRLALDKFVEWNVDHEWIGSRSCLLATPGVGLDVVVSDLADNVGLDVATLKYVLMLILAYPLAAVFARLPNPMTKHLFSFIMGVWMMQFVFFAQWIHSFASSAITYILVYTLPNRIMPQTVFAFALTYMCMSHIYRIYVDYMGWSLDFTGPQMVLTIKLSSFAYNVYDGRLWDEISRNTGDKKKDRVLAARRDYALRSVADPLSFFGYIFCFSSILAGPAFEYRDYTSAVTGTAFQKNGAPYPRPSSWLSAMKKFVQGMTCLALFQVWGSGYPMAFVRTKEMLEKPMWWRVYYTWLALFFIRMKYFFAWKTADGASVLGGFGFEGYDKYGKVKGWDGVSNIDILAFETSPNVASNTRAWNKRTQGWLERYVYMRTGNSLTATYFVSAFWHGFYPGYYLFFMSLPLATAAARAGRKKVSPYFAGYGFTAAVYHLFCVICVCLTVNYLVIPFQMLGLPESLEVWGVFYFAPHVCMIALYGFAQVIPTKKENGTKNKSS